MKIIKGDLVLKENYSIDDDLKVEGNIRCEGGSWDIDCEDIDCWNIEARDINCGNIDCEDIDYWAVCFARESFVCKSVKGRRGNSKHFCLDKEIEYINKINKICEHCGK